MSDIDAFVRALLEAHRSGRPAQGAPLASPDYRQALSIQRRVQAKLGPVGGFKVAWRAEGPPVIAPIRAGRIFRSGANVVVRGTIGIELEIGFEALTDACPGMMETPELHFRPRIVLELVGSRLCGAGGDPMKKLADMQDNDGLVLGPGVRDWDGSDFSVVTASLRCGGDEVLSGPAAVPGGSALGALGQFLDHVGGHCGGLRAGQVVITGSLSPLGFHPGGTGVFGAIRGFGELRCLLA